MNVSSVCQSFLESLKGESDRTPSRTEEVAREVFSNVISEHTIEKAPIETIQKNVLIGVLGPMLDSKDLVALSSTSKTMRGKMICNEVNYAWVRRRAEITIGPDQWESVGFKVKEVPPLPKDIDEILKSDCPYFEGKKVHETHKLILMPGGLSINKQGSLMRHLREGDVKTVFRDIWDEITGQWGKEEVEKPYWALVTNEVIPNSRNKSFEVQKGLIKEGYEVPSVLDATALVTMAKECSEGKEGYLLPKDPWTYTRCKESNKGEQLIVGAFAPSGLFVLSGSDDVDCVGVLALRKFC